MWLRALRVYLVGSAAIHLAWETLQLPLYTLWRTETWRGIAFALLHCTAGDVLIALAVLVLSLLLVGGEAWPARGFHAVAGLAMVFGLGYTVFSEWLNVAVRASWAYSDRMPVVTIVNFQLGLAPLLQWIVVPIGVLAVVRRMAERTDGPRA
jgi:hypothetical protein